MPASEPRAPTPRTPTINARFFLGQGWPYLLVPFIPAAIALDLSGYSGAGGFIASALGILPTAALMGRATEELASRSGPRIGGLLNVTFGNAPELIIALFALGQGLHELVKATLIGSIVGNILLVLGASMLVGGLKHKRQTFSATSANVQSTMLLVAAGAFAVPAAVQLVGGDGLSTVDPERIGFDSTVELLSGLIAAVLIVIYLIGLYLSLTTTRDVAHEPPFEQEGTWGWSVRLSVAMLAVAGLFVGVMSEVLVGSIGAASGALGLSEVFLGPLRGAVVGQ